MADVFVSYSRRDLGFVQRLAGDLTARGKDVWVDVEGIRDAEVFPQALQRAIESSDAFVFVISPDAVRSEFCEQEVAHAAELNKRIVPLAWRQVPDAEIPEAIRFRNWIPAGDLDDQLDATIDRLVAAIDTDLEWERHHTRLTVKALEWDATGRHRSLLLRGPELASAEQWLATGGSQDPGPSQLEQEFVLAARRTSARRQRAIVGASLAVAVVSIGLLIFALISRGQAIAARNQARLEAEVSKSRALAAESQTQVPIDPERSILLAADAVRASPTPEAMLALRGAIDASPIRFRLPDVAPQTCGPETTYTASPLSPGVAFSPDGSQIAEALCDGSVILANGHTGRVIRRLSLGRGLAGRLVYNRASGLLAAVGAGRIDAIDPATDTLGARGPRVGGFTAVASDPTAPLVAFAGTSGVTLWNLRTHAARVLPLPGGLTASMLAFSPDGARLAVALNVTTPDQRVVLIMLNVRTGRILASLHNNGLELQIDDVAFSPNGREIAVAQVNSLTVQSSIVVRDSRTLAVRKTVARITTESTPTTVAFSPDGSRIAYGAYDGTAGLVSVATGQSIVPFLGQTSAISQVAFSPDGRLVMTASQDGTVRVWRGDGLELRSVHVGGILEDVERSGAGFLSLDLLGSSEATQLWSGQLRPAAPPLTVVSNPYDGAFISDAQTLAGVTAGNPGTKAPITIWNVATRRVIGRTPPTPSSGGATVLSPNGRWIADSPPAAAGYDVALIDTRAGHERILARTSCATSAVSLAFTPDGRLVAAGESCGDAQVWSVATGRPVGPPIMGGSGAQISSVAFSPDGRQLAIGSQDDAVTVANVDTGTPLAVLNDQTHRISSVSYSPNGRYLVTTSYGPTIDIYDAHTHALLRVITDPDNVYGARFTANSQDVVTFDSAGFIREWDACTDCENPRALLALADTRVTRQLTKQEITDFGVG